MGQQACFPLGGATGSAGDGPNRCRDVPMRIMNVAPYPVTLPVEAILADLEAVEAVRRPPDSAGEESEERAVMWVRDRRTP